MAGLLYERAGDVDKAITMFEEAREFKRAAVLRRNQVGDRDAAFDERWLALLIGAGTVEPLAEFCFARAREPLCSMEEQVRLFRRIKHLAERELVASKWLDEAKKELQKTEAANRTKFDARAGEWAAAATRAVLGT